MPTRLDNAFEAPLSGACRRHPNTRAAGCLLALAFLCGPGAADSFAADLPGSAAEDCERLAAFPEDPAGRFEGVPDHKMAMPLALTRCQAAVASAPDSPVHIFLLGRTLLAEGQAMQGLERLKQAGEMDYAAAWYLMGQTMVSQGAKRAAAEAYEKAAVLGHPGAQLEIGALYSAGTWGLPKDEEKAVHWLSLAKENGDADAAALLGSFYLLGKGLDYDPSRGLRMIEEAVAAGSQRGLSFLGMAHLVAPEGDKELGERLLAEQARKGDLAGLLAYTSVLDFKNPDDLERARRLFCRVDARGAQLYEAFTQEKLVCDEG